MRSPSVGRLVTLSCAGADGVEPGRLRCVAPEGVLGVVFSMISRDEAVGSRIVAGMVHGPMDRPPTVTTDE
ncbi:MAG: hypothetical protein KGZ72_11895 [Roseovarius sp.]|nr:hypothetical protein [Roseovarius sp.]